MTSSVITADLTAILDGADTWAALRGRRFLVTGATGMIGQYLVRALLALGTPGEPVTVLAMTRRGDVAARLFGPELSGGGLQILVHDVAQPTPPLPPLDYVIHAGSPANPVVFREDPVSVIAANSLGTANLLAAARDCGATFCLLSSAEIYGEAPTGGLRLSEASAGVLDSLDPRSAYPESKRLAEALCIAYQRQHGVDYRIARLAHTYGPGMSLYDPRVQTYFMRQALRGEDIILQSDGQARRNYMYVSDAVSGLLHLLAADGSLVCNIADESEPVSIADLARTVLRCSPGARGRLRFASPPEAATPTVTPPGLDCSRLRALGWRPRVGLEAGIRRTLEHHRDQLAAAAAPA